MARYTITLCTNHEILTEGYKLDKLIVERACRDTIEVATEKFLEKEPIILSYLGPHHELVLETNGNFRDWKSGKFYRSSRGEEDGIYFRRRTCYGGIVHVVSESRERSAMVERLAQEMVQSICDMLSWIVLEMD